MNGFFLSQWHMLFLLFGKNQFNYWNSVSLYKYKEWYLVYIRTKLVVCMSENKIGG
jgi:hypothetical protein